jgi:hypothetical protein
VGEPVTLSSDQLALLIERAEMTGYKKAMKKFNGRDDEKSFDELLEYAIDDNFHDQAMREARKVTNGNNRDSEMFALGAQWAKMFYSTMRGNKK